MVWDFRLVKFFVSTYKDKDSSLRFLLFWVTVYLLEVFLKDVISGRPIFRSLIIFFFFFFVFTPSFFWIHI